MFRKQSFLQIFKGRGHDFDLKCFSILMFTMLQKGIIDRQPKFGFQLLSYKAVTELKFFGT